MAVEVLEDYFGILPMAVVKAYVLKLPFSV